MDRIRELILNNVPLMFLLLALMFIINIGTLSYNFWISRDSTNHIILNYEKLREIREIRTLYFQAELLSREYVLDGDDGYLKPFISTIENIDGKMHLITRRGEVDDEIKFNLNVLIEELSLLRKSVDPPFDDIKIKLREYQEYRLNTGESFNNIENKYYSNIERYVRERDRVRYFLRDYVIISSVIYVILAVLISSVINEENKKIQNELEKRERRRMEERLL